MPAYDYLCDTCGPFTAVRPMAAFQEPCQCDLCGEAAPRAMLSAPAFAGMDGRARQAHATNERSANVPVRGTRHASGCGCCRPAGKLRADAPAARSFPAARPWMIG